MADFRIVEFRTQYRNGRDPYDEVCLAPPGEGFLKTQTWHRVNSLIPKKNLNDSEKDSLHHQAMLGRWAVVGPAYEAWKQGVDLPEEGTPLAAWAGVTPEMASAFRNMGLKTVEDVRDHPEQVAKLNLPNARQISETAGAYLEGQDSAAKDEKIANLAEQVAAMEEMLAEATTPKRGRPKKEAEAA